MINFFVETKYEYTTQLVNVLTPLIYEGLNSIYGEALKVSNNADNVLKVFQSFLRRIPKWNTEMIKQESDRIMNNSKSYAWLPDLVKATLKANMLVLTYSPSLKNISKIDPNFYKNIQIEDFIHKVYIEVARELWNNPYLMYHLYPPIELKRNQRDTIGLIKDSIKEAIRKLLPLKQILEIYLGEELEPNQLNDFEKNISEAEERNIQKLINKDLKDNQNLEVIKKDGQIGGYQEKSENKDLNEKILDIINKDQQNKNTPNNVNLDEKKPQLTANYHSDDYNKNSADTPMTKATKTLSDTSSSDSDKTKKGGGNDVDDKIKKILEKDLGETDLETSLSYRPETNDKDYQEIFANSLAPQPSKNQSAGGNNSIKDTSKNKRKFFSNYLNI
jgi:hypothetical protein